MSCSTCKTNPLKKNISEKHFGYLRNKSYTAYFCSEECKTMFVNTQMCCNCRYGGEIGKTLSTYKLKTYCSEDWYDNASCLKKTIIANDYYVSGCDICSGNLDDILDNIKKIYNRMDVHNKGNICTACYGKLCLNILKVVDIL